MAPFLCGEGKGRGPPKSFWKPVSPVSKSVSRPLLSYSRARTGTLGPPDCQGWEFDTIFDLMLEWGFKQLDRDDPIRGGAEKFAISRKVHNFVRESIQNSWDQRRNSVEPVRIVFSFADLEGLELERFLADINWTSGLEEHLRACAEQNNHDKKKLQRNLGKFGAGKVRVLRVSDHNTKGLTGPELGEDGNFCKLCRNEMIPSEGGAAAGRGGSFGVGKSVYWSFSGLNTVVFSSVYRDDEDVMATRVFGRTYLPTHQLLTGQNDPRYSGDAFMCIRNSAGDRVPSDFSTSGIKHGSLLHRDAGDYGTSIVVVMYEELESEEEPSLGDTAQKFRDAIVANFWPLLHDGSIEVVVEWRDRGGSVSAAVGVPEEFAPFTRALMKPQDEDVFASSSAPKILEPGETAFFAGEIKISARTDKDDPKPAAPDGNVSVSVTRLTEDEKAKLLIFEERYGEPKFKFLNRLANIRGARMVVENREYVTGACFDHVGVVRAGRFRDMDGVITQDDECIEQFLRDSEPPAHDEWQFHDKVKNAYDTPWRNVVSNMYSDIGAKARKLLRVVQQGSEDRPDGLAKLLAGRPAGPEIIEKGFRFRSNLDSCEFDIANKVVRCKATVRRVGGAKQARLPWTATVGMEAVGEQGDESLDHHTAVVTEGYPAVENLKATKVDSYTVSVPADKDKFEIELVVSLSSLSDGVIRRLRLGLSLTAKVTK